MNSPTSKSLTVLLWNSNGLARRRNELDVLLHDKRVDVAMVTETHFTNNTKFFIRDYTTYSTNHPDNTARGGAAILIKSTIQHFLNPSTSTDYVQASSITVKLQSSDIVLSSSYWPPNQPVSAAQFISYFLSLGPRFLSGGDFNAKHPQRGCRASNPRGHSFLTSIL